MPRLRKNKFVLGVTGCIGSGKSTVAGMFKGKDCLLIDADKLARGLFCSLSRVYQKIKKCFGQKIFKPNAAIDRGELAGIVFTDPAALAKLNRIVHPELIRQIRRRIRSTNKKIVILDAALIIEARLVRMVDKLVVVIAKREQQIKRCQRRLGLTKKQVILRMKSQISQKQRKLFADFIIDNRGSLSETQKQVSKIRRQLWKS